MEGGIAKGLNLLSEQQSYPKISEYEIETRKEVIIVSQSENNPIEIDQLKYSKSERKLVILFAFIGTVFDGADFFIFTYFLSSVSQYFGTSLVNTTFIQASSYLAGIIGGIVFGMLADKRGRNLGLTLTVAVYSIFTLLCAFSTSFSMLLVLRIIAGIGIGGELGIAAAYMNEVLHADNNRRGLFSGILQSMMIVGSFLAAWLFAFTSQHYGTEAWRWAFGYLGVAGILAAFIRRFMPESKLWLASKANKLKSDGTQKKEAVPLVEIFRGGLGTVTLKATILLTLAFYGAYALLTFAPTMWSTIYNYSPATVAHISYIGNAICFFAYIGGGWLSDRIGRRNLFGLTAVIGTVGFLAFIAAALVLDLPGSASFWASPIFYCYVITLFGFGYSGVVGVWMSELYPTRVRSTAENFVYYVGRAFGGGVGPVLGLSIALSMGYDVRVAIAFGLIGMVGVIIVSRLLRETFGTDLKAD